MLGSYNRDPDGNLRDQPAQQQVSAVDIGAGTVVGRRGFTGSKEDGDVSALRSVIGGLAPGTVMMAGALHTNRPTAQLCLNNGLSCGFMVKGSQPNMLDQPERADAATLLVLSRGYWRAVENGIHWVCDVVLGEDTRRIHSGMLPRVMAALANLAISILRLLQVRNIKRTMKQLVCQGGATSAAAALLLPC